MAPDRMSDLEALMWGLETDPHLSSNFAVLSLYDTTPEPERLRRRMWRTSRVIPRLRRRVTAGLGPLANPAWEEDPDFDLDRHLRTVTLPKGATDADARALAGELAAEPFDRDHPLWQFTVIEGLPDGRAAMVQKMHHTITDGEGGIRMSVEFIDLARDTPEPLPVDDGPPAPPSGRSWPILRLAADVVGALGEATRHNAETARHLVEGAVDLTLHPTQLASALAGLPADAAATTRSLVRQLGVVEPHRSPIWNGRSLDRRLETFEVSLADVKAAAHALGGSVNDLFVAAAVGGAGAYHRRLGCEVAELRMSMPVSTRTDRGSGGNAFTPTRVLVSTDADPRRRFTEIHERLSVTKTERAASLAASLAGLVNLLPHPAVIRLARQQVMTVDFATSNVRAAPFALYMAGARMTANFPLGPVAGTAWNLTTMSYCGQLDCGLHVDPAAVTDPRQLRVDIEASFAELIALA